MTKKAKVSKKQVRKAVLKQWAMKAAQLALGSAKMRDEACKLIKSHATRKSAKEVMLPAFAKVYGAKTTTDEATGAVQWADANKKGSKSAAAKKALNRLLNDAFGKKRGTKSKKAKGIVAKAESFAKGKTVAQLLRSIEVIKAAIREAKAK